MSKTKPIIGLAGGIGSGKSTVAGLMAPMGGRVIDADALAHRVLQRPDVRGRLVDWWGPGILDAGGLVDRQAIADRVFDKPDERKRLEELVHPLVRYERQVRLEAALTDENVRFIVQDVPLLFEVGMDKECDFVLFVHAPRHVRAERVRRTRGWDEAELERREKNQWPVDRKKVAAHAIIQNDSDEANCLEQIRSVLDRFLQGK